VTVLAVDGGDPPKTGCVLVNTTDVVIVVVVMMVVVVVEVVLEILPRLVQSWSISRSSTPTTTTRSSTTHPMR